MSCTLYAYWSLSTRVCFPQFVASQYSVLRNFDLLFLHTRYLAVGDTRLLKAASYTLLHVCVVITSRQLHVVCIACFNSTTYENFFFSSYVTDIHFFAALAPGEWACLYPVIKADVRNLKTWFYDEIVFFNRRIPFFLWGWVSLDFSRKRDSSKLSFEVQLFWWKGCIQSYPLRVSWREDRIQLCWVNLYYGPTKISYSAHLKPAARRALSVPIEILRYE